MDYGDGLENRCPCKGTVGSNPTPSATAFTADLVAPCGMNCAVCSAYRAYVHQLPKKKGINHCIGCRARGKQCAYLKKYCGRLGDGGFRFCSECPDFPCAHLSKIDERYRTRYNTSFIANLKQIRDAGIDIFLADQRERYRCPRCGGVLSIHSGKCYACDQVDTWRG